MNGRDLAAEMAAASAQVRLPHLERLRALGVPYEALADLNARQPTIGIARVATQPDGLFALDDTSEPACIVAVVERDDEPGSSGIVDLIAFRAADPARWWWRTGAGFALGADLLRDHGADDAGLHDGVPVVRTPLDWLAIAGRGACVLDWDADSPVWPLLRFGPPLTFSDDLLRQRVRNGLVETAPLPSMRITNDAA